MGRYAVAVACAALSVACALAQVNCNTGFVEYECTNDFPICCIWKENNVIGACCPDGSTCALYEGLCLIKTNSSRNNTTPYNKQGGVTVGVSEAAAFITFAAIGFIVALVACAFLGFKIFVGCEARRQRRREAERQALLHNPDSDDDGNDNDDAADANNKNDEESDVEEEGRCNICYEHGISCVLMPCAHVCTCRHCAARLQKCPICREEVARFVPFKNRLYPRSEKKAAKPKPKSAADGKSEEEQLTGTPRPPTSARPRSARGEAPKSARRAARGTTAVTIETRDERDESVDQRPQGEAATGATLAPVADATATVAHEQQAAATAVTVHSVNSDVPQVSETAQTVAAQNAMADLQHETMSPSESRSE
jgi:hypothetical protein